ncbi:hypothetical protein ZHAS_00018466 [Anopheles sinensis]|uniref:Uncharacterized protein n=1 Tax=Anopheles sinensis TaxID=74873 RepID=A0A084WJP2_ANOSI|nr:hypothetical protein ZHAS_00018466 [Anopheles sinensis]
MPRASNGEGKCVPRCAGENGTVHGLVLAGSLVDSAVLVTIWYASQQQQGTAP